MMKLINLIEQGGKFMQTIHLAEDFSLLALSGQRSNNLTFAKRIALRSMAAAAILELYLAGHFDRETDSTVLEKEDTLSYHDTVLDCLLEGKEQIKETLPEIINQVTKLSKKDLEKIEGTFVAYLNTLGVLKERASLLSCDLEFETAGVEVKEYYGHQEQYQKVVQRIRTDILDKEDMTDEVACLFWLLKESGVIHDVFSEQELEDNVIERFYHLLESHALAKEIFPLSIQKTNEGLVKKFLDFKEKTMNTAVGAGVNFVFPVLHRSEAVFIETETYFADKDARLHELTSRLEKHRVPFTMIRKGAVPMIDVNGVLYEAVPYTKAYRMQVHGIQLRRYVEG